MTRTILASATALLAATTLFTSAAEACISCDYVPEVVRNSQTSQGAKPAVKARAYTAEKKHRTAPAKSVVKSEPVAKAVETAKAVADEAQTENENSSITAAANVVPTETATKAAQTETATKAAQTENSSISLASNEDAATEEAPVAKPAKEAAAKPVDCKKFFPSVGMTLTVPCE